MKTKSRWWEDERVPRFCAFLTTVLYSASVATLAPVLFAETFSRHDAAGVRVPKQALALVVDTLFNT